MPRRWRSFYAVLLLNVPCLPCSPQYVEAISNKQTELDNYIAEGYKNALSEERRRYCFLVDRQCAVAKNSSSYHSKVGTRLGDPRRVGWISTSRLTAIPPVAAGLNLVCPHKCSEAHLPEQMLALSFSRLYLSIQRVYLSSTLFLLLTSRPCQYPPGPHLRSADRKSSLRSSGITGITKCN